MLDRNWDALKRSLILLTRLRQGPADKATLIKAVRRALPDAYSEESAKAQSRTFERDLENVRYRLQAEVAWQPQLRQYVLHGVGPFLRVELSEEMLTGLAFLMDTLTTNEEIQRIIRPLLDQIVQALPPHQIQQLSRQSTPIHVNLQRLSESEISPEVWRRLIYAIKQRRVVRFHYASPLHEHSETRQHTVEPYEHYFRGGHFYLKGYCLRWVAPNGWEGGQFWASPYRLDYILPADFMLLGTFVHREKRAQLHSIRYKLAPQIVRGGVSRYFDQMRVGDPDAQGWVEVTAQTDNLFEAHRILLAYGEQCQALEPPELVDRMARAAGAMAAFYPAPQE
jgi:predicted DNA-binding transcriptional regulator YafY